MSTVFSQPHFIFGLRKGVKNNLCFVDEQTVVFPSGNSCVIHNTVKRWQRFIPGLEGSLGLRALALSPNQRYLAVSEKAEKASVTVFDLHQEHGLKRNVLTAGDFLVQEFLSLAFSPDSKYLIGQSGAPEWLLIFWSWEKNKLLATEKTTNSNNPISQISFSPHNNMQVCVSGNGIFKLFRYSEGNLKQNSIAKVGSINILCHTWLSEDRVIAGTDTGRLLVSQSGDVRREIKMCSEAAQGQNERNLEVRRIKAGNVTEGVAKCGITAILSYSKGFVCSTGPGTVSLFEKIEDNVYRKSREIQILPAPASSDSAPARCQEIDTMCMSPAEETLAVSTDRGQLYSINLSSAEMKREEQLPFDFLSQPFHSASITGLSICIRKPFMATSSLDCSVRIWNYETKELELYKEFREEAFSVALHPTGLFVLVGFSDKLRLMNLFIDDIRTFKDFALPGCRECAFSHGGHMFAAVDKSVIHIYSFTSFENILNLNGHFGKVRTVEWSFDDSRLVSCGADGAVYEWNTHTGKLECETVLKACSYFGAAFSWDYKTVLAVGTDLILREIQDCQVLREVPADAVAHTALAVSQSGRVVFTGTARGTVRAVTYPLPDQKEWITQQAHCGPVTRMVITYDDQFLLTASEDGCLLISKIVDQKGRGLRSNRQIVHTEEILVTKADLKERAHNMLELKMHLEELHMEKEYQLRLQDMNYKEELQQMSNKFTEEIKSLKTTQQILSTEIEQCEQETQLNSAEVEVKHCKDLKDLDQFYTSKLTVEHEKYEDLLQKHKEMQEEYETRLIHAHGDRTQNLAEVTQMYEAKLQAKTQQMNKCQKEAELRIREYEETIRQTAEQEQQKIYTMKDKYEKQLQSEKEAITKLKGNSGTMTQKVHNLQKQIDDRLSDITSLKKERHTLMGFIRTLETDICVLKKQVSKYKKICQEKDKIISSLHIINQDLQKLKIILEFKLKDMKKQIKPQQVDINEKAERIQKLEEELILITNSSTRLKVTISELRLRLRTKDKEIQKELQRVQDLTTLLERVRSDLQVCASLIQDPRKLKDNILMIYFRYASGTESAKRSSAVDDAQKGMCSQCGQLEMTVSSLQKKLVRSAKEHEDVYTRMMKDNMALVTEINELRKALHAERSKEKDSKVQQGLLQ
ncbi:cilia- and flagella-associated protein 57 isoform X1 [Xiphophorus couchianus]|uniref:cilia- and flagella-associated protein 57 isoform X1 n=1 Tax=Xiphophorus couchianus TaxID=32473 RepID=UPI00101612A3|nr:cilia- and flagella-associated protein 57 isoform X1 [Xiphophorus couchianus]